jgi:DNA-binding transcriptional LysR family regulator
MTVSSLSLAALRYAAAVASQGSFSAAARECEVAQPTVSNAVADLEEALGARLFERSTKRVALTPAGERLLPLVRGVLDGLNELEQQALALKVPARKLLSVGFSSLLPAQRLGSLFEPFRTSHPDVEIIYKECALGDMEGRLEAGTIDFVCGTQLERRKQRARQLLYSEALHWVAPNAVANKSSTITLREVAGVRLLLTVGACGLAPATRDLFKRAGIAIHPYTGEAISYSALEEWAELGIGGAVLPESRIRSAPSTPLVEGGRPVRIVYEVVWRKDHIVSDHGLAFVQYLRNVVPRLIRGGVPSARARA